MSGGWNPEERLKPLPATREETVSGGWNPEERLERLPAARPVRGFSLSPGLERPR
jgi:hypothetical protein